MYHIRADVAVKFKYSFYSMTADSLAPLLADCYQQSAVQYSWAFIQGLLIGQLSLILICVVALRWLLLDSRSAPLGPSASKATHTSIPTSNQDILSRIGDEFNEESCQWLNLLIAQIIVKYRTDATSKGNLQQILTTVLNSGTRPAYMVH